MMTRDETHEDFDYPTAEQAEREAETVRAAGTDRVRARAARTHLHQERAAADVLYGARSGTVTAAPIDPPRAAGGGADPSLYLELSPLGQRRHKPPRPR